MVSTFEWFVCCEACHALAGAYATRTQSAEFIRYEQRRFDRAGAALDRLKREAGVDPRLWYQLCADARTALGLGSADAAWHGEVAAGPR